jgi:hypothetical protein
LPEPNDELASLAQSHDSRFARRYRSTRRRDAPDRNTERATAFASGVHAIPKLFAKAVEAEDLRDPLAATNAGNRHGVADTQRAFQETPFEDGPVMRVAAGIFDDLVGVRYEEASEGTQTRRILFDFAPARAQSSTRLNAERSSGWVY